MKFGRKSAPVQAGDALGEQETPQEPAVGPFDDSEVDVEERECIDLGSLLVSPVAPMELRLQVDEDSGQVLAAILVTDEGALELRAFAASRGGGAWEELRPQITAETVRRGGTATEQEGSFGPELLCVVPVETPEGEQGAQPSRIIGYDGPRWLLRATLMGPPALEAEQAALWEDTIRQVVVRRGREAMPPGTPLPLHLPPEARRAE